MSTSPAVEIAHLAHRYGEHEAIHDLSLSHRRARNLRDPRPQRQRQDDAVSRALDADSDAAGRSSDPWPRPATRGGRDSLAARRRVSVAEHRQEAHGAGKRRFTTAGCTGSAAASCARGPTKCSTRLGLADRRRELVEKLSGGLRRRVELATGMLHRPRLLLLDEPSTGLDPGARSDLWQYLEQVREDDGVTVVLTTHLLEEAQRADRIAIMHKGKLAALDTPAALQAAVGGDAITIRTNDPAASGRRHRAAIQRAGEGRRRLGAARASRTATNGSRGWSKRFPIGSNRSRSASRRWKTCSSISPATGSGTRAATERMKRGGNKARRRTIDALVLCSLEVVRDQLFCS